MNSTSQAQGYIKNPQNGLDPPYRLKVLFIERINDVNFMKDKRLSVIHVAKPLFRELGISLDTITNNIEIATTSHLPPNTVFPNIIEIDNGKWGNSGNRS